MRWLTAMMLAAISAAFCSDRACGSVTVNIYGHVSQIDNTTGADMGFAVGDVVRGQLTYDPATPATTGIVFGYNTLYTNATTSLSLKVGDYELGIDGPASLNPGIGNVAYVSNNRPQNGGIDHIGFFFRGQNYSPPSTPGGPTRENEAGPLSGAAINGYTPQLFQIYYSDDSGSVFTDESLPGMLDLTQFDDTVDSSSPFKPGLIFTKPAIGGEPFVDENDQFAMYFDLVAASSQAIPEATSCLVWLGLVVGGLSRHRR